MTPEQQAKELCNPNCQHGTRLVLLCMECVTAALEAKDLEVESARKTLRDHVGNGFGGICAVCGFRYHEHNGHIIACPVCALGAKDAENNDLRSLDDLHRRHELVPNNEVGCSCPSCNLHNRYRTEIEQWKLVKEANDNGLKAIIAQLRSELAEIKMLVMWPTDDMEPPYRNLPHSDVIDRIKKIVAQAERKGIE